MRVMGVLLGVLVCVLFASCSLLDKTPNPTPTVPPLIPSGPACTLPEPAANRLQFQGVQQHDPDLVIASFAEGEAPDTVLLRQVLDALPSDPLITITYAGTCPLRSGSSASFYLVVQKTRTGPSEICLAFIDTPAGKVKNVYQLCRGE